MYLLAPFCGCTVEMSGRLLSPCRFLMKAGYKGKRGSMIRTAQHFNISANVFAKRRVEAVLLYD
jgi:Zn-dependent peptidase ImmA (M78 family)